MTRKSYKTNDLTYHYFTHGLFQHRFLSVIEPGYVGGVDRRGPSLFWYLIKPGFHLKYWQVLKLIPFCT